MRIAVVTPESDWLPPETVTGNSVTAERWQAIFESLGHEVTRSTRYGGEGVDLLVALNAHKSGSSIERFRARGERAPLIVALTGTDLYVDLENVVTKRSLDVATQLVVLQPGALDLLSPQWRQKTTVIYQSAEPGTSSSSPSEQFGVIVVAHLREVKDPFLGARAVAGLPTSSRVRLRHIGAAADESFRARAASLQEKTKRYEWLGPKDHAQTRSWISRSDLLLLTSREEGGANVLSEALALGVPIVSTRARGVEGLLGPTYPGLVPVGDVEALRKAIHRAETDRAFYSDLEQACRELSTLVSPELERATWRQLLEHVSQAREGG